MSRPTSSSPTRGLSRRPAPALSLLELVLVALAGPGLRAEPALEPAGPHAGWRAAGLRVARATALGRAVAVAARLHALGLPALLGEVRRPWRVPEAFLLVAPRELEQRLQRAGVLVDVRRRVAMRRHPRRHGVQAQVAGLHVRHLLPPQRGGDARVGRRSHRPAGGDGPVAGVLVVVEEDAVALLLPPLGGRELGHAALDLAPHGERRAAHGEEVPARLDAHVDVDALGA